MSDLILAITLNEEFYTRVAYSQNWPLLFVLAFLCQVAVLIGQLVVIVANRYQGLKLIRFVIVSCVWYVLSIGALAFVLTFASQWWFDATFSWQAYLALSILAFSPTIFSFSAFIPYLGQPIERGLMIWSLINLLIVTIYMTGLNVLSATLLVMGSWLISQVVLRTIFGPLFSLRTSPDATEDLINAITPSTLQ